MFSADLGGAAPASAPSANDPQFQKVALLLHGDGTNGAQNNTFVDGSTNNFTTTRYGNTTQGTFTPFSQAAGYWSNYFDGSGDYLSVPASSALAFGTGDFTVEAWVNSATQSSTQTIFTTRTTGQTAINLVLENGNPKVQYNSYASITAASKCTVGTWYHIAVSRYGSTIQLFVNGISQGTSSIGENYTDNVARIGYDFYFSSNPFSGYISNVRVVKGTAVYTSNFTPSTTPLTAISGTSLLTCQSNRFIDNSSNNFTITPTGDTKVTAFSPFAPSAAYDASTNGGSGYFDGSGDYLSVPVTSALTFGSNSFTVEFWSYGSGYPISTRGTSGVVTAFALRVTTNVGLLMSTSGVWNINTQGGTVTSGVWNHIALVRNGTNINVYVNGVSVISQTLSGSLTQGTSTLTVGIDADGAFTGYLSNVRIINGTALYTSNFTPPTAPLTAVTNTQLLLNCTNAGIIDNSGKNDIETVGNAQISTSVKKYGTGSMYFDGTGDFLYISSRPEIDLGSGDFTIEFWINAPSRASLQGIVTKRRSDGISAGTWGAYISATNGIVFSNLASGATILSFGNIPTSTWTHVAISRSGSTCRGFVNGSLLSTTTSSVDFTNTLPMFIGLWGTAGGTYPSGTLDGQFNGYIDDLRITKGQALYTSNFTPPTQAFPNV